MKNKNILNVILILVLTLFALWFALKDDSMHVLENLSSMNMWWLLLAVLFGIFYISTFGFIISLITRSLYKDYSFFKGIQTAFIGAFFNGVTPVGTGQIAQTYCLHKQGIKTSNAISILWLEFIVFQITMAILVGILFIVSLWFPIDSHYRLLSIIGYGLNCSVIFILLSVTKFPRLFQKLSSLLVTFLNKLRIVKDKEATQLKWQDTISSFMQQASLLKGNRSIIIKAFLLNIVRMLTYYAIPIFAALSVGAKVTPYNAIFILLVASHVHMMNALTPLPGDTGFTETMFILIFMSVFEDSALTSSIMIVWRVTSYHISILIGGLLFLKLRGGKQQYLKDMEETKREMEQAKLHNN